MNHNKTERRRHRVDAYWGIGILVVMFGLTFYFGLKEDKKPSTPSIPIQENETSDITVRQDSVKSLKERIVYSEFYEEGYKKGYAAGEEDTNDGDYRSGFDNSNTYKGQQSYDYCMGYERGYEDAYEEIIDTSDDDEEEPI